jgi:hypothetical protein
MYIFKLPWLSRTSSQISHLKAFPLPFALFDADAIDAVCGGSLLTSRGFNGAATAIVAGPADVTVLMWLDMCCL